MKFLLDNNLPPALARALAELSVAEPGVERVAHLSELFAPSTEDARWILGLSDHGSGWYIISLDKFRKSKGVEREALRRAGHTTYVLDKSWSKMAFWPKAVQLIQWWPRILEHARLTNGGVHSVRWKFSPSRKFDSI